jgi:plasmid stability protein
MYNYERNQTMPKKDERLTIAALPEDLQDMLKVYATIQGRSVASLGSSLLCTILQMKLPRFKERMEYLAKKRGMSYEEFWEHCMRGQYEKMSTSEFENLLKEEDGDSD